MSSREARQKLHKGILCTMGGTFCMALISILGALAIQEVSGIAMVFLQSAFALLVVSPILFPKRKELFNTNKLGLHALRGLLNVLDLYIFYTAFYYLPIVNVVLIENSTPVFIPVLSMIWLKEKIPALLWLSIIIGFMGLYFVVNPNAGGLTNPHVILPFIAAILSSFIYVSIRKLEATDSNEQILFFYLLFSILISFPFFLFKCWSLTWYSFIVVMGMGIALGMAQWLFQMAYRYAMPGRLAPFLYLEIIFTVVLTNLFFGMVPAAHVLVGLALILFSGLVSLKANGLPDEKQT